MLRRELEVRDEFLAVTLEAAATDLDERVLIVIQDQSVRRSEDPEMMERRPHLRREREIRGRSLPVVDDHAELVDDVALAGPLEQRADESVSDHGRRVASDEFRDSRD